MTKCRCLSILAAVGFLTVGAAQAADQVKCPKVSDSCGQENNTTCYYKFTVTKDHKDSLDVTYPVSVFSAIDKNYKDQNDEQKEKDAKEKKGKPFSISVKQGTKIVEGKTYKFTRCPDSLYSVGKELDPTDETHNE